ncbi:MAG: TetR/AcrR family transcriptional regulator [Acidimicrobiales bacterium]|jgi:AcrR family transcriptional regulator
MANKSRSAAVNADGSDADKAETRDVESQGASALDRRARILEAACRAIARQGSRRVRLQDIAAEGGVSKGLLHYYAQSREALLAEAYAFGDRRQRIRAQEEIAVIQDGADRLRHLLHLYFTKDARVWEDWLLWSEFSASAVFDTSLQPAMKNSFATWLSWLEELVIRGIQDGSIVSDQEPAVIALKLAALVDGLGLQMVRGLIDEQQARSTLGLALEDFGIAETQRLAEASTAAEVQITLGQARQALRRLERLLVPGELGARIGAERAQRTAGDRPN